jgi:hypothetical protein
MAEFPTNCPAYRYHVCKWIAENGRCTESKVCGLWDEINSTVNIKPKCENCRHYQKESSESGLCPILLSLLDFKYEEGPPFDGFTPVKSILVPNDFSCVKFDKRG